MKLSRVRSADWVAGIGGLVLLVSLWLHWYGFDADALIKTIGARGSVDADAFFPAATLFGANDRVPAITAWQAFSELDVLLALLALPAIGVPISAALSKVPTAPVAFTVVGTTAGFFAVLLVLFRIIDQPGSNALVKVEYGAWIGLAGAVLAFVGSWLAMADEHTPGAVPPQLTVRPAP